MPAVLPDAGDGIAVQPVVHHGVAYHIILIALLAGLVHDGLLRLADRPGLQLADDLVADGLNARQLHLEAALFRFQRPSGGGHADPAEAQLRAVFQPFLDRSGHLRHLGDVLDLAVQHGPLAVIFLFYGQDVELSALHPAHHADDAAGPDVQGENISLLLFFHRFHALCPSLIVFLSRSARGGDVAEIYYIILQFVEVCNRFSKSFFCFS